MRFGWFVAAVAFLAASHAGAHEYKVKDLTIGHPWARATHGNAGTGVVYVTLVNDGKAADRLLKASTPVAAMASLHETIKEGDVMKMREIDGLAIPAGATVELKPGAWHIMLMGLKKPLREGDMVPLTLTLANEGEVQVEAMVSDQ